LAQRDSHSDFLDRTSIRWSSRGTARFGGYYLRGLYVYRARGLGRLAFLGARRCHSEELSGDLLRWRIIGRFAVVREQW
jgi:hypothetical protein